MFKFRNTVSKKNSKWCYYCITLLGSLIFSGLNEGIISQTIYNKILEQKTITIGISLYYPPLNMQENNVRMGIESEMIQSLSEFLGVRAKLIPLKVNDYVKAMEEGRVQLIIAGMSRNLFRARKIWFSDPYMTIYPSVLVDNRLIQSTKFGEDIENPPIVNLWDLNKVGNLIFIVKDGSIYKDIVKDELHSNNYITVPSNEEGLNLLKDFKANAFLHDSLFFEYLLKENPGLSKSFTLLRAINRDEYFCVGIPFGDLILKNQINIWIAEIIRTKKLERWMDKYLKNEAKN